MTDQAIVILYMILMNCAIVVIYVYAEVRIYRKGGKVFQWVKRLSHYLDNLKTIK